MNLISTARLSARRNRGGSFFTMLIFIMMLLSTGLMYYYFQRTRSLERQVVALQNGDFASSESKSGIFGFLGLDEKKMSPSANASGTPAVTPAPVPEVSLEALGQDFPASGTASTPTPKPLVSELDEAPDASVNSETTGPDTLSDSEEMNGSKSEAGMEPEPMEADGESQESGNKQNLESMYDAPPPVRVRAPQRDGR